MKVRTGFVSNSSSSSFVLVGVEINKSDLKIFLTPEQIEELDQIVDVGWEKVRKDYYQDKQEYANEIYEQAEYELKNNRLKFEIMVDSDMGTILIGKYILNCYDGQRLPVGDFMKKVDSACHELEAIGWDPNEIQIIGKYVCE